MHPQTDIICLVHNTLSVTKGFVEHLYKHTENFRLIFIDNGSDLTTADYLSVNAKKYGWTVIRSNKNLGVIKGRNLGAQHIQADYFLNIDNDQYVQAGWLQGLHDLMEKGYDIVGCEAWCLYPPNTKGVIQVGGASYNRSYFPFRHCQNPREKFTYVGCGGMLIKTKVYRDIGLFDEQFNPAYFEDPDFSFRAIQSGYKLGWKHDCPIKHLSHQTMSNQTLFQKSSQFTTSWKKFQNKWLPYFPQPMQTGV